MSCCWVDDEPDDELSRLIEQLEVAAFERGRLFERLKLEREHEAATGKPRPGTRESRMAERAKATEKCRVAWLALRSFVRGKARS